MLRDSFDSYKKQVGSPVETLNLEVQFRGKKPCKSNAYRSSECVCHSCKSKSKNSKQRLKIVKKTYVTQSFLCS